LKHPVDTPTDRGQFEASQKPMLDAVVVAYQSNSTIHGCVKELLKIPGLQHVVVVDHGDDGAGVAAEGLGATVVYDPKNPGFGVGQNRGIALTSAPYVLMCNPDAVVLPEAIAAGLLALASQRDLAALQGAVRERDRDLFQRSYWQSVGAIHLWVRILRLGVILRMRPLRALGVSRRHLLPHGPQATREVQAMAAITLLIRREAFEEIGGFDPAYFLYWEDLDLCKRLRNVGWRLCVTPDTWAVHIGGASSGDAIEREHQWWRGCMRYTALWYPTSQWLAALGAATVQWLTLSAARPRLARCFWRDLITTPRRVRRDSMYSGLSSGHPNGPPKFSSGQ